MTAEKNICWRNLQGKFESAPQAEQVNFRFFLLGGGDLEGRGGSFSSFSLFLRAT